MKKIEKIAVIVFAVLILLSILLYQVDYLIAKEGKDPIFSIKIATFSDRRNDRIYWLGL